MTSGLANPGHEDNVIASLRTEAYADQMMTRTGAHRPDGHDGSDDRRRVAGLRLDLIAANMLVWIASVGRDADLTSDAHLFFFDHYQRLADFHRQHGRPARARRLQTRADEHYRLAGGDGPPFAAAIAMPRPARWLSTDAVSRKHREPPDEAA
jgi:hypothetical protein